MRLLCLGCARPLAISLDPVSFLPTIKTLLEVSNPVDKIDRSKLSSTIRLTQIVDQHVSTLSLDDSNDDHDVMRSVETGSTRSDEIKQDDHIDHEIKHDEVRQLACMFCHCSIDITGSVRGSYLKKYGYGEHLKTIVVNDMSPTIPIGTTIEQTGSFKFPECGVGRSCMRCKSKFDTILPESEVTSSQLKDVPDTEPLYLQEGMRGPQPTLKDHIFKTKAEARYLDLVAKWTELGLDTTLIQPPTDRQVERERPKPRPPLTAKRRRKNPLSRMRRPSSYA